MVSYFTQSEICQRLGTSFTLDDVFYITYSDRLEQNKILVDEQIIELNMQILSEVIQDISGGSIGLLLLINEISLTKDLNKLLDILYNDSDIESKIITSFSNLDFNIKETLQKIVWEKPEIFKASKELENIYFSGVCNVKQIKDNYYVRIDSWLLEVQVKKY